MPDWKKLKVGDRIRMIAVPKGDLEYEASAPKWVLRELSTVAVIKHMIQSKRVVEVEFFDDFGRPWVGYIFRNKRGKKEDHCLSVSDNVTWEYAKPKRKSKLRRAK